MYYLITQLARSVEHRLKAGVTRLFADPQSRLPMNGDTKDAAQLEFDVTDQLRCGERLDGVVDEAAIWTEDTDFELAVVDTPTPAIQLVIG